VLFTDGIVRPVFIDDAGHQYVIDRDGHTRRYGTWLPEREGGLEADAPLVMGDRETYDEGSPLDAEPLVCVPGCALLGAVAAVDSRFSSWGGTVIGSLLGLFFGLAFGGALPRAAADYFFGPEERAEGRER
jgi:hypothetical protein